MQIVHTLFVKNDVNPILGELKFSLRKFRSYCCDASTNAACLDLQSLYFATVSTAQIIKSLPVVPSIMLRLEQG